MTSTPLRPSMPKRRPARRRALRWVKRGLLALLGAGVLTALAYAFVPRPVEVDVAAARRTPLDVEVDEDGQTRVVDRFVVSAPISGYLARIGLEAGAGVARGDVVARIQAPDPSLLDERSRSQALAQLDAAIAHAHRADTAIARATAARDAAVRDADRARTLASRGAITAYDREQSELAEQLAARDLEAAHTDRSAAAAEVAAARAVLGEAPGARSGARLDVTSPANGRILRVIRDSAGPVAAGAPLLELGDPHAIEAVIDVLSSDAARIVPGMQVAFDAWGGGAPLHGKVRLVEPSAFTRISALGVEEQRVHVIATIDDPPVALGDGFRVEARIFLWRGVNVLTVPASAVFRDRGRWAVYAAEGDRARLRPVELGHRGRLDVEIVRGIDEEREVIVHPSDSVVDGARIERRATVHEADR